MLHQKTLYLVLFLDSLFVTQLSMLHCFIYLLSAAVLTELGSDINFLPQHFSHHLQSGGTPMGMNYSKVQAQFGRAKIRLCRDNSDCAALQIGQCLAHGEHRRVSLIGKLKEGNIGVVHKKSVAERCSMMLRLHRNSCIHSKSGSQHKHFFNESTNFKLKTG